MSSTIMQPGLRSGTVGRTRQVRQGFAVRLLDLWFSSRAKQRSRQQLAELDTRLLRDIGIDRATAYEEARRSVWQ